MGGKNCLTALVIVLFVLFIIDAIPFTLGLVVMVLPYILIGILVLFIIIFPIGLHIENKRRREKRKKFIQERKERMK